METAKVDIRKLQLLNDRINLCIDALNQVRVSVHGLSQGQFGQVGAGVGFGQVPYQQAPYQQTPYPQIPFGIGQTPLGQPFVPGMSHTSGVGVGIPGIQNLQGLSGIQGLSGYQGLQGLQGMPWLNPYAGLSHTSPELSGIGIGQDPYLVARIGQTFPFAQFAFPPVY